MDGVFFSVIVPVYNTAKYFPACVASILSQSFTGFELFLVDDGSTDGSENMADRFASQDSRVRAIHIAHAGVSTARNTGLERASGQYVLFVDSDDILTGGALERLREKLTCLPDMLRFGCGYRKITETGMSEPKVLWQFAPVEYMGTAEIAEMFVNRKFVLRSVCFGAFRLSVIKENHITFRERMAFGEDRLFNLDFLKHCSSLTLIPDALYVYTSNRSGSGSHRPVCGMASLCAWLHEENVSVMRALCDGHVSEMKKNLYMVRDYKASVQEAMRHFKMYTGTMTYEQKRMELEAFFSFLPPKASVGKGSGLGIRFRLWITGFGCVVKLRSRRLLRLFICVDGLSDRRNPDL